MPNVISLYYKLWLNLGEIGTNKKTMDLATLCTLSQCPVSDFQFSARHVTLDTDRTFESALISSMASEKNQSNTNSSRIIGTLNSYNVLKCSNVSFSPCYSAGDCRWTFALAFVLIVLGRLHICNPNRRNHTGKAHAFLLCLSSHSSTAKLPPSQAAQHGCDKLAVSGTLFHIHFALGGGIVHVHSYLWIRQ